MHELIFWGAFGLLTEVVFTAIKGAIVEKKINLIGHTSLWMLPIYAYGLAYGFDFIIHCIPNDIIRYFTYPAWIWAVEIVIGYPTAKLGVRIWNYDYLPDKYHWNGIISFVHFPLWMLFGILVEVVDKHMLL